MVKLTGATGTASSNSTSSTTSSTESSTAASTASGGEEGSKRVIAQGAHYTVMSGAVGSENSMSKYGVKVKSLRAFFEESADTSRSEPRPPCGRLSPTATAMWEATPAVTGAASHTSTAKWPPAKKPAEPVTGADSGPPLHTSTTQWEARLALDEEPAEIVTGAAGDSPPPPPPPPSGLEALSIPADAVERTTMFEDIMRAAIASIAATPPRFTEPVGATAEMLNDFLTEIERSGGQLPDLPVMDNLRAQVLVRQRIIEMEAEQTSAHRATGYTVPVAGDLDEMLRD